MVESGVHYTGFFQKMQWRVKIFRERSLPWERKLPCGLEHAGAQGLLRKNSLGVTLSCSRSSSRSWNVRTLPSPSGSRKVYCTAPLGRILRCRSGQGIGPGWLHSPRSLPHPLRIFTELCDAAQLDQFSGTHIHFQRKHQIVAAQVTLPERSFL